jgi:hypothetical protein
MNLSRKKKELAYYFLFLLLNRYNILLATCFNTVANRILGPCLVPQKFCKNSKTQNGAAAHQNVKPNGLVFWLLDAKNFAKH